LEVFLKLPIIKWGRALRRRGFITKFVKWILKGLWFFLYWLDSFIKKKCILVFIYYILMIHMIERFLRILPFHQKRTVKIT